MPITFRGSGMRIYCAFRENMIQIRGDSPAAKLSISPRIVTMGGSRAVNNNKLSTKISLLPKFLLTEKSDGGIMIFVAGGSVGTGRRARLRILWLTPCRFNSCRPHQTQKPQYIVCEDNFHHNILWFFLFRHK